MSQDQPRDGLSPQLAAFQTLVETVDRLRSPGGCPWDLEQTHQTLKRHLVEECYETLEAIDSGDPSEVAEELGDILIQVLFHSDIAEKAGDFSLTDVMAMTQDKLRRRHPHVFGDLKLADARAVEANWERIKQTEGRKKSAAAGIPPETPALAYAQLMQERVARNGFDWGDATEVPDKIVEEAGEVAEAQGNGRKASEIGDLLFMVVNLARWEGVHAEDALRQANARFQRRYEAMERLAIEQSGAEFSALSMDEKQALWHRAKRAVG